MHSHHWSSPFLQKANDSISVTKLFNLPHDMDKDSSRSAASNTPMSERNGLTAQPIILFNILLIL